MGLGKRPNSLKQWQSLVSRLDFWGVNCVMVRIILRTDLF